MSLCIVLSKDEFGDERGLDAILKDTNAKVEYYVREVWEDSGKGTLKLISWGLLLASNRSSERLFEIYYDLPCTFELKKRFFSRREVLCISQLKDDNRMDLATHRWEIEMGEFRHRP